jgi:hypothetical protein
MSGGGLIIGVMKSWDMMSVLLGFYVGYESMHG